MDADAKKWHGEQVDEYVKRLASFKNLASVLKAILERARDRHAPGAIVQAREKTIVQLC